MRTSQERRLHLEQFHSTGQDWVKFFSRLPWSQLRVLLHRDSAARLLALKHLFMGLVRTCSLRVRRRRDVVSYFYLPPFYLPHPSLNVSGADRRRKPNPLRIRVRSATCVPSVHWPNVPIAYDSPGATRRQCKQSRNSRHEGHHSIHGHGGQHSIQRHGAQWFIQKVSEEFGCPSVWLSIPTQATHCWRSLSFPFLSLYRVWSAKDNRGAG